MACVVLSIGVMLALKPDQSFVLWLLVMFWSVLIGDLVTQGYLRVHTTLGDSTTIDERRELIGRTLRGLRAL